ncbi:unnamed protein product [Prorocentrum cordatum]|uniref:Uncharacterized protein n=1 Tax=Prorocentrum cordatum TaxID=2364126 RepID=A0ABN9SSU9_9DINO|nr:unnamed protein product [Polarella glacialis]
MASARRSVDPFPRARVSSGESLFVGPEARQGPPEAEHGERPPVVISSLLEGVWGSSAFVDQMAADDAFDAPLTEAGVRQAAEAGARAQELGLLLGVELAVASPLSRALDTADALLPPSGPDRGGPRRAVLEELREINGLLLNAKRRPRAELEAAYPHWDFSAISPQDDLWTEELESRESCAARGRQALGWIWEADESEVPAAAGPQPPPEGHGVPCAA